MPIADPGGAQGPGQHIGVELRVEPRARNRSDIDQQIDGGVTQQYDQLLRRTGRMADGVDHRRSDEFENRLRRGQTIASCLRWAWAPSFAPKRNISANASGDRTAGSNSDLLIKATNKEQERA